MKNLYSNKINESKKSVYVTKVIILFLFFFRKVETMFYDGRWRINGEKVHKKAAEVCIFPNKFGSFLSISWSIMPQ